ncbi:LysM peptidoglycan-binding domain-containing protein [Psychrobacter fozii]|uniref:LysM peptidoglycan-binding domain-containing protein n=1 Tax=Psychrobacter fozii TaxID=198480 RepID=UPI00191851CE|nr:LysM peptidoglycan-binding domain-containing protein [Psychrobacter fozii]
MSNSQKKLTAWFVLLDAKSKVLKNIEYKVTAVNSNEEEEHVVKGKTNSKGATYEFVKPIHTKLCLYVKIGTKDFKKAGNISLPPVKENRLKIKAKISAVLIDSKLKKHGNEAGSIKRKDYKVVTGDTLESIAKKHNTDIATLKRLNPKIKSIHKIFAGHWLKVPVQIGDVGKETEDKPSPSVSTKPPATKTKGSEPVDSEQPWYDKAWDSVKDIHDEADAMIDRAEEAIKDGQQKIIKGTLEAKEQLYDTVFGDDESSKTNNKNKKSPAKTESSNNKTNEPPLEIKKKAGNNQNGNPAEQITYDSNTTVYHIYHDGRIERANGQADGFARFIYYDETGGKHELGKTEYLKTPRYGGGGNVYLVCIGGDVDSSKHDGSQIDDNNISPVEKKKRLSKYRKGNVGYNITMNSKEYQRYYLSGVAMATFLGALCKLGYDDISFNGASKKDGSPGPSSSHTNGKCIDVRYLRKDKKALEMILDNRDYDSQYDHDRNVRLVNTFHEFGWGKRKRPNNSIVEMLSVYFTNPKAGIDKRYILPHCGPYEGHENHLHLQGLVANIKDIDVISKVSESSSSGLNITSEQLKKLFPQSSQSDRNTVVKEVNAKLSEFKLDTHIRQRHFFSQIKGEVGDSMKGKTEGWNYSPDALLSFSDYYKKHKDEAYEDGYEKDADDNFIRRANERAIGEKHFSRLNGNRQKTHPQDGYNFRGRGLIQLTGYEKYNGFMENYNNHWKGTPPDTVKTPDLINKMPYAIQSAMYFWLNYNVYSTSKGNGYADVTAVTKKVNGGREGLDRRKAAYKESEGIFK